MVLQQLNDHISSFFQFQKDQNVPVIIVSSGGTRVPLERNAVRFIDNFSEGTRGAASVEHFVSYGCATVFLYRHGSILPWHRHIFPKDPAKWLDIININNESEAFSSNTTSSGTSHCISYDTASVASLSLHTDNRGVQALKSFQIAKRDNRILYLQFNTLDEYLELLKETAVISNLYGKNTMFYLAAAVSDFFVPNDQLPAHKIQSGMKSSLDLHLSQVPKKLGILRHEWAPDAFIVSFKLETEESILLEKCHSSMSRYSPNLIVGNILDSRKDRIFLYRRGSQQPHIIERTEQEKSLNIELEAKLIPEVLHYFAEFRTLNVVQ